MGATAGNRYIVKNQRTFAHVHHTESVGLSLRHREGAEIMQHFRNFHLCPYGGGSGLRVPTARHHLEIKLLHLRVGHWVPHRHHTVGRIQQEGVELFLRRETVLTVQTVRQVKTNGMKKAVTTDKLDHVPQVPGMEIEQEGHRSRHATVHLLHPPAPLRQAELAAGASYRIYIRQHRVARRTGRGIHRVTALHGKDVRHTHSFSYHDECNNSRHTCQCFFHFLLILFAQIYLISSYRTA